MSETMTDFATHRKAFHTALVALSDFIRIEERLSGGLDQGRLAFYGTADPKLLSGPSGQVLDASKAARFLEWFSLERPHGEGVAAPVHSFVASGCPGLDPEGHPYGRGLGDTRVGVYLVKDLDDEGMDLEDAISGTSLSVLLPDETRSIESGDTLLGRLLPVPGADLWMATDAMERIAGSTIFDAFVEDIERNKLETGQEILDPVSQRDLELLLGLARGEDEATVAQVGSEILESRLAELLENVSEEIPPADEICRALEASPSPGPVMDQLLEDLAFYSEIEIEAARHLILELWTAYHAGGSDEQLATSASTSTESVTSPDSASQAPAVPVAELGATLLAELEAAEEQGVPTEAIFEKLEKMVQGKSSSPEVDGPPEEIEWRTPDQGNLHALLAEYLWERGRIGRPVDQPSAERLAEFVSNFRENKIHEVEGVNELTLARTLVQSWAEGKIQGVHDLMCDLVEWEGWLEEVQETGFGTRLDKFREALITESDRLSQIESEMPTQPLGEKAPGEKELPIQSWHVLKGPRGGWILESAQGRRPWQQDSNFMVGDLILGAMGEDAFLPGYRLLPRLLARGLVGLDTED